MTAVECGGRDNHRTRFFYFECGVCEVESGFECGGTPATYTFLFQTIGNPCGADIPCLSVLSTRPSGAAPLRVRKKTNKHAVISFSTISQREAEENRNSNELFIGMNKANQWQGTRQNGLRPFLVVSARCAVKVAAGAASEHTPTPYCARPLPTAPPAPPPVARAAKATAAPRTCPHG